MAKLVQREEDNVPGNADSTPSGKHLQTIEDEGFSEGGASADPDTEDLAKTEADPSGAKETKAPMQSSYYRQVKKRPHKRGLSGWSRRKKLLVGFGAGGITAAIVALLLSILPFELIHIKHMVTDNIGGTQARTYRIARGHMYSSMYFFDKEGNFTGDKVGGIRRLMGENRQTKAMVKTLEKNNYAITFDQRTGKVQSLAKIDTRGQPIADQTYASNSAVRAAWEIKKSGDLNNILRDVFPDKSDFWYNRSTNQLYRRWGLTRTNWLEDKVKTVTGVNKAQALELQFRDALRNKLFGSGNDLTPGAATQKDPKNQTPDEALAAENKGLFERVKSQATALRQKLLNDPSAVPEGSLLDTANNALSGDELQNTTINSLKSVLTVQTFNVLNAEQNACMAKSALNDVVTGARVLRASQLRDFSLSVLNIADAMQNGKSVTSQQVNAVMSYLNSKDSNGKTMFASSGWQYYENPSSKSSLFKTFDKNQRDEFSAGGGFTGTLGLVRAKLDGVGVGKNCSFINNPLVSFGGLFIGLGLGVLSGGSFSVVDVGFNIATGFAAQFAVGAATQMLTPMVAGTIINGGEKGTAIGNAFISGAEILVGSNASNMGMRPLSTGEFKLSQASLEKDQKTELKNQSVIARLFSPKVDTSLTTTAATKLSNFKMSDLLSMPMSSLGRIFKIDGLLGQQASAAGQDVTCPDQDISDNKLAATPFCNVIMGIPDSVLNDPKNTPDLVDAQMSGIDNEGNPIPGIKPQVDINGEALTGSDYEKYITNCTAKAKLGGIDIIHTTESEEVKYTDRCHNDLFNLFLLYLTVAQGENDALNGTLGGEISPSDATSPAPPAIVPGDLTKDSSGTACAAGTKDLDVQEGFADGNSVKIRACALTNLASSGEESTPGSRFYVNGADGHAIVNSLVSKAFKDMIDSAGRDKVSLSANSTFRTMAHQQDLCAANAGCRSGNYESVAKPGTSNHQLGIAIDFSDIYSSVGGHAGQCSPKQTSATASYKWLDQNAANFGIKQYCAEAWHWSPTGS